MCEEGGGASGLRHGEHARTVLNGDDDGVAYAVSGLRGDDETGTLVVAGAVGQSQVWIFASSRSQLSIRAYNM